MLQYMIMNDEIETVAWKPEDVSAEIDFVQLRVQTPVILVTDFVVTGVIRLPGCITKDSE